MKKLIIVFFLISYLGFGQTKDETIDWLNLSLEHYGDNQVMGTYQISTKVDSNYGEMLIFTKKTWNPLLQEIDYSYYSFLPKVVSSVILSGKNRTNNTLDIFIISDSGSIYIPQKEEFTSEISIHMKNGNNEMTERIHRGLLHLFELMGNKIEPQKELFKN
ncbi:hypothetical protein [Flagellimonas baculiformis]|uniref:hypothetical protein n=1 Tax=Flagellimonas baculiformis TaxID=3067310 RepID=UPI00296FD80C|nr:hypothetical protein [Muricauda sp. D6]